MSEWISVKDRLPKEDKSVIATNGIYVYESFCFDVEHGEWDRRNPTNVTHWMPLPEPPNERKLCEICCVNYKESDCKCGENEP